MLKRSGHIFDYSFRYRIILAALTTGLYVSVIEEGLLGFIYITKFKSKYPMEKRVQAYITVLQDANIKKHKIYIDF